MSSVAFLLLTRIKVGKNTIGGPPWSFAIHYIWLIVSKLLFPFDHFHVNPDSPNLLMTYILISYITYIYDFIHMCSRFMQFT
ncbi:hypothetical protein ZOSMA_31G01010 [Zostera marina]|uniref:Uncharacterized protein n=1 Tax=Zostera marina TaxID=29655 RepID=A0A0K9P8X0_ZOSMR|nr:hypothetical protein ZOSMA_31G01010 [Zostera marina]